MEKFSQEYQKRIPGIFSEKYHEKNRKFYELSSSFADIIALEQELKKLEAIGDKNSKIMRQAEIELEKRKADFNEINNKYVFKKNMVKTRPKPRINFQIKSKDKV